MLFDAAFRPSFVARLRLSPRLGRIFFKKQTSNQLNDQLVIAICDLKISLFERRVSAAAEPEILFVAVERGGSGASVQFIARQIMDAYITIRGYSDTSEEEMTLLK